MSDAKKLGIIFDMDGTLWDSAENVAKSWSLVTETYPGVNRAMTEDDLKSVMGLTMDNIAATLFSQLEKDKQLELLKKCCEVENEYLRVHGGMLYDGLEQTLVKLREKYCLCIVSNCQSGYIEAFLEYFGFAKYFEDIECFGNNGQPKDVNIRLIAERNGLDAYVYVGDVQGDCDSSLAAGAGFIHAAYGFGKVRQQVPAIHSIKELPAVADKYFSTL